MSSPNHALDSPVSDDYSTVSTGVLDTHSIGGTGSADGLTANFKSKRFDLSIFSLHRPSSFNLDHSTHATDSRSTTVSESASASDHHQHISPPLNRDLHPFSQSTVDSLHSCKTITTRCSAFLSSIFISTI